MSTCSQLSDSSNSLLSSLDSITDTLNSGSYGSFNSSMTELFSQFLESGEIDTDSIMSTIDDYASTGLNDIYDSIKDYTGDCLDSILNPVLNGLNDIASFGESLIGEISSSGILSSFSSGLLSGISSLTGIGELFNSLGISSIISGLDSVVGCLSSASCLGTGEIDSIFDKVNSFTSSFGLTSSGNFDISSWLTNTIINIGNLPSSLLEKFTNGISNLTSSFTSWINDFQGNMSSLFSGLTSNLTSGITGLVSGIGSIGGIVSSVTDFFGGGTSSTPGKNATPIKSGKCDAWDKDKQLSKLGTKSTPEGSTSIWS